MAEPEENTLKVLLVEDDEDDYLLTEDLLGEAYGAGFELEWAPSYAAGLQAIRRGGHDVCLLDYRLGGESGLELVREALSEGCRTPLILLTGQGDREIDLEAMRAGASYYLIKAGIDAPLLERSVRHSIERARILAELRQSEERYSLAVSGATDGVWDWDLVANRVYYSPRWKGLLGYGEEELSYSPEEFFGRIHPDDLAPVRAAVEAYLAGSGTHFEMEFRMLHRDGRYRWIFSRGMALWDSEGAPYRMAGSQTDVTERKRAEEQLQRDAFYDAVTSLPNRALFTDRLGRSMRAAGRREGYLFAVLSLGLDRFKLVNDSLGREAGDSLLEAVARRLEELVEEDGSVARLGGDEFAILAEDIGDTGGASRLADRVQEALGRPFDLGGDEVFVSVSIGIALGADHYQRPQEPLRDAEAAMYRAKAHGKARHEFFEGSLRDHAMERLRLESELRRAIERDELELHYQPLVTAADCAISGCEALVRWRHPERGLVSPAEFIPLSEETGLITDLGEWVLRTACAQARSWRDEGRSGLHVAVNLSARQFRDQDLPALVESALGEAGVGADALRLEITESLIMSDAEGAVATLRALSARGVEISIDDFGTGYSSLAYLKGFPVHALKIDRSFVRDLDADDQAISAAIVALGHNLGLRVIAEGVETEEQLRFLRDNGCDELQGFYFSKPLPAGEFAALLEGGAPLHSLGN